MSPSESFIGLALKFGDFPKLQTEKKEFDLDL